MLDRRTSVFLHDIAMVALAWQCAWLARSNFYAWNFAWRPTTASFVIAVVAQGLIFWHLGLYRGLWRFASLPDLWNILRAAALGTVTIGLLLFVHSRLDEVPRSILLLYPVFLVALLSLPRLVYRYWKDRTLNFHSMQRGRRVIIVGAGRSSEALLRDMLRDGRYQPVGILDDESTLRNTEIRGVPVLGSVARIQQVAEASEAELIVIAMPSASNVEMQRIVEQCEATGLPFRTLPRLVDQIQGEGVSALRDVSIDDLLGRDVVSFDLPAVQETLSGKTVMVSGGGGSIGAELCRQIARLGPNTLIVLDQSEYNLFEIDRELREAHPAMHLRTVLGDVTDVVAIEHVMRSERPQVVFHAAAYKHVPLLQFQGREAVRNNVIGTWRIASAAVRNGCRKFVLISTDKAVNPSSLMGATKRMAEVVCEYFNQKNVTQFVTVRFGNVLGSAGSVVPIFQEQIRNGGPVTVTHPEMTRFFMTIPEASQLILQAAAMGRGGEIFVLDMGQPVKIAYLAERLIRLSGRLPGRDIRIEYTGVRPGERLHEELFHDDEHLDDTSHRKIFLARHRSIDVRDMEQTIDDISHACDEFDEDRVAVHIRRLVPEMRNEDSSNDSNKVVAFKRGA